MSNESTLSFDRMRGMLMRAAEIRDSEQQQIFDSLDEIHARLAALDALGNMRKRLTELPDRTEVSVLAERLDETVAKLDAQDGVLASLLRAVESLPDKLAKPFAQLDGRLDGMGGRMEGISGRMDGLDDRLGGLHKRLDDLDNRLDRHEMRLDAMPSSVGTPIKERIDGVERQVREQLAAALRGFDETGEGLRNLLGDTSVGLHRRLEDLAGGLRSTRPSRSTPSPSGSRRWPRGWTPWRPGSTRWRTGSAPGWTTSSPSSTRRWSSGRTRRRSASSSTRRPRGVGAAQRRSARRGHGHVRGAHPGPRRAGAVAPAAAPPHRPPEPQGHGEVVQRRERRGHRDRRPRRR